MPLYTSGPCNPLWSVISSPNVAAYSNQFYGVAAISASDVWAVGGDNDLGNPSQTLVEHWDGSNWSVVSSPNVGTDANSLNSVAAISASDVWAVGKYSNSTVTRTLIEHWNGSSWSVILSPNLGTTSNVLNEIWALSANDVWAVGYGGGGSGTVDQTLVEHWDGSGWTIVPSPNSDTLQNELYGVSAISANDVWAVGNFYNTGLGAHQTLIEHWDGNNWSIVASSDIGASDDFLNAVTAVSANDIWTVGFTRPLNFTNQTTLVEHWDGSAWTIVPSPNVQEAPNGLFGVAAAGPADVWAVGYDTPSHIDRTLAEHWDGSAWTIVPSPNDGTSYNYLMGVAAIPPSGQGPSDVWAVGNYSDSSSDRQTLIERYEPCQGSPTATSTRAASPTPTMTPALTSTPTAVATSTDTPTSAATQATQTAVPTETPDPTDTVNPTTAPTNSPTASSSSTPGATGTGTSTATPFPTACLVSFE